MCGFKQRFFFRVQEISANGTEINNWYYEETFSWNVDQQDGKSYGHDYLKRTKNNCTQICLNILEQFHHERKCGLSIKKGYIIKVKVCYFHIRNEMFVLFYLSDVGIKRFKKLLKY